MVYTCSFLITSCHVARMDCIFCSCAFQSGPSRGCWRDGFSSRKVFTHPLMWLESDHWVFNFYNVCSNTLDIWLWWIISPFLFVKSLEGSAPILRALFYLDVSGVFGGGSEVVRTFSRYSRVRWLDLSHPTYLGLSSLVFGFSSVSLLVWRYFFLAGS